VNKTIWKKRKKLLAILARSASMVVIVYRSVIAPLNVNAGRRIVPKTVVAVVLAKSVYWGLGLRA
jgi:hypothetical protein